VLRAGVSQIPVSPPGELVALVAEMPAPGGFAGPVFGPDEIAGISDLILSLKEAGG